MAWVGLFGFVGGAGKQAAAEPAVRTPNLTHNAIPPVPPASGALHTGVIIVIYCARCSGAFARGNPKFMGSVREAHTTFSAPPLLSFHF